jgi:uncharacterized membrane protein/Mg-chelatase subunit ChlD
MSGIDIGFDKPLYLLLLTLLPILWFLSFRSLAGLGRYRRLAALALRSIVLVAIILALAEIQLLQTSDKVTVIYVLDQSESIPLENRQAMLDYVVKDVQDHRNKSREDKAGVVVFGRNATIEIPPFDDDITVLGGIESYVSLRTDATNLEGALKLAQASFSEDSSKRIVVLTDGNENMGDARAVAAAIVEDGIGIDVRPVELTARAEVAVERIKLPSDIRKGQPIEAHVVMNNYADHPVPGRLKITRRVGPSEQLLAEQPIVLEPGKRVLAFKETIEQPAVYTYQADFVPDDPGDDLMTQNNRATTFTAVRGEGRVLFIEDWERPGEFDELINTLRDNNIEIDVQSSNRLFTSLAELQGYDSVVLANVPRSSGNDADSVSSFSDEQIEMLVRNTEQMGCGLVMLGGPDSFGIGGWSNTEIEKAMPIDFQIKNAKIRAVGAVVMLMHASELADGNYWQKKVAEKSIMALGPMDYCGLIHWDLGGDKWLWNDPNGLIQVGSRRRMMMARLGRMTPGDMPEFDPAMKKALLQFNKVNASVKLLLCISDGDPSPPSFGTMASFKAAKIQVSTVAIGAHGRVGHQTLQRVADYTGGRYYVVKDPRALPKIYVSEVRRVARPLIYEPPTPVSPVVTYPHEIVQGIDGPLPPITGFVLTTVKDNPLVEVAVRSPVPADERNSTILAAWSYGLGRTAVLTTDVGQRWATSWVEWENYDKLFTQMVRWSMRPVNDTGKFAVTSDVKDGRVRVVVTALDKNDEFLNLLNMEGSFIDPGLESSDLAVRQVAPGRYLAEYTAPKEGNYFMTISPGPGHSPIMTGINVPYSSEFRERETNMALLDGLARLRPKGGERGQVIDADIDTFRKGLAPAVSSQDVWPMFVLLTACVFFADIFVRRVTIGTDWVLPAVAWVRAKLFSGAEPVEDQERMQRLRSKKAAIAEEIDDRRAAARFEPVPDDAAETTSPDLDEVIADNSAASGGAPGRLAPSKETMAPEGPAEESYTARLLKAKKKAFEDEK